MDEFEKHLSVTKEVEKEQQTAEDNEKLQEVVIGRQELYLKPFGTIIFDMPSPGLSLKADQVAAKFKAYNLRHGEFLTNAQLKAIYNQPITITVDGKEVKVGNGEWPEKNEVELESLQSKIDDALAMFEVCREEYQNFDTELLAAKPNTKQHKELSEKVEKAKAKARTHYDSLLSLRSRQLQLTSIRAILFADSLEEQAFLEKVKLFVPSCIKKKDKDGNITPFWNSIEEFENDKFSAVKIVAYFNLFLRGLDISFFGDVLDEVTSS